MTQRALVWSYLNVHEKITRWDAFIDLGIAELSARIGEVEAEYGVDIPRKYIEVTARNGNKVRVMQYGKPVPRQPPESP